MKKKISVLLVSICVLFLLIGCGYKGYGGESTDLYTVAINSVLWNNGHSFSADRFIDSQIEIIDEDIYGRKLFMYYEKYYAGADISFSSLIVCQKSNEEYVFYYEDINFILMEQKLYTSEIKDFEPDKIDKLKLLNDWNKEIDFNKCIKKEVTKQKADIPYDVHYIKNKITKEFDLIQGEYSLFMHLLTYDLHKNKFILYGYVKNSYKNDIYFATIININKSVENLNFFVPTNIYDYQSELMDFKIINEWISK